MTMALAKRGRLVAAMDDAVIRTAYVAVLPLWRAAVASDIRGSSDPWPWELFRRATARMVVLVGLAGQARAWANMRMMGVEMPPDDGEPLWIPETFDRDDMPEIGASMVVGPFEEAVSEFRGRVPALASNVRRLMAVGESMSAAIVSQNAGRYVEMLADRVLAVRRALRRTFHVERTDMATLLNLRELLAQAIEVGPGEVAGKVAGMRLPEFISRARLEGAAKLTDVHLENVYRTNLSSALNEGQVEAASDPAARQAFPLLYLSEIHDRRTRGSPLPGALYPNDGFHWQMDGFVGTVDDFRRWGIVPPNGYFCRGGTRLIHRTEAKRMGFILESGALDADAIREYNGERMAILESGEYPDKGFRR